MFKKKIYLNIFTYTVKLNSIQSDIIYPDVVGARGHPTVF